MCERERERERDGMNGIMLVDILGCECGCEDQTEHKMCFTPLSTHLALPLCNAGGKLAVHLNFYETLFIDASHDATNDARNDDAPPYASCINPAYGTGKLACISRYSTSVG